MSHALTRDDIIDGLRDLVGRVRRTGGTATIQIVGGAAIALSVDANRAATVDIDGPVTPFVEVSAIAKVIASERGWPSTWINDSAAIFLPDGIGRRAEWETLHDRDGVVIQTASPEMLLAMKLRAAERRGIRDLGDVAVLLSVCGIRTADAAEELLNGFFPGEDLSPTTYERVESILAAPLPSPARPLPPDFD